MKKDNRGRPRLEAEPQKARAICLSDRHMKKAREIGEGSASRGIRKALDDHK